MPGAAGELAENVDVRMAVKRKGALPKTTRIASGPAKKRARHLVGCRAVVGVVVTAGELSKESIQCNRSVI